ncbi:MAG: hypothetical protein R2845_11040 [Thermomicrobiales bacterium]
MTVTVFWAIHTAFFRSMSSPMRSPANGGELGIGNCESKLI